MARYYAEICGSRGEASRMGTEASGMWGHIRGWHVGAAVRMHSANGEDVCVIEATTGSAGSGCGNESIGRLSRGEDGNLSLTPSTWLIEQVAQFTKRERAEARKEAREAAKRSAERKSAALREAWRFFHDAAGGIVGERAVTAMSLARAEARAAELGISFYWFNDPEPDVSWMDADQLAEWRAGDVRMEAARAVLDTDDADDYGSTLASLYGIHGADDEYRRVVNAELALEALASLEAERNA